MKAAARTHRGDVFVIHWRSDRLRLDLRNKGFFGCRQVHRRERHDMEVLSMKGPLIAAQQEWIRAWTACRG